ncbi:endonuclease/exonuclease/phosphatase family protein [Stratiformator vulcanicus]|uniref:Endonuclease/Exonuclease/phosphatase family protein n=1 Tax=Stratiformator vulcanicus TaxID=2527980 RepID=A0A517R3Z3_9PLAN|nr:endonuclease/exonuclease/phosphatase family protein [Stratiformator vulcanicus]QDT38612.1 Endonuclease/Exonuclease/phosphatase family protein [Stratiformator vulcanicus]
MRSHFRYRLTAICCCAGLIFALVGCDAQNWIEQLSQQAEQAAPILSVSGGAGGSNPDVIRIATFNIQVYGQSKAGKPEVMRILADTIRRYDVVAIQEIRSKDPAPVHELVRLVNATGRSYDVALGPRLGRTSSKEQYAFVYDTKTLELARKTVYTLTDRRDWLHREPYVARFRVRREDPAEGFTFSLVNIHTDPDEVDLEVDALDDVLNAVWNDGSGEDDVILLGDLNAAPDKFGELGRVPGLYWVISSEATNTRRTKLYDNVLFDRQRTPEFTGSAGVFDFQSEYRLSRDKALDVSDHLPVWAEFSAIESKPGSIATAPGTQRL